MRKEPTKKKLDQWKETNRKGVAKYQEKLKSKSLVLKVPVFKAKTKKTYLISKRSVKQVSRLKKYNAIKKEWFKDEGNQFCKLNNTEDCKMYHKEATEPHHTLGVIGELLFDTEHWLPTCRLCHTLEHSKTEK